MLEKIIKKIQTSTKQDLETVDKLYQGSWGCGCYFIEKQDYIERLLVRNWEEDKRIPEYIIEFFALKHHYYNGNGLKCGNDKECQYQKENEQSN